MDSGFMLPTRPAGWLPVILIWRAPLAYANARCRVVVTDLLAVVRATTPPNEALKLTKRARLSRKDGLSVARFAA